ncbi:hypothetical protein KUCAC02_022491 [Chaenocephalus aceratus]|uniref:Uncharacterized protein n=1 Tax=Chaenocephalus aceratus TaxID=36190 RepID=A0ACB9XNY4_CHAAC|nr:hypothetical protein KUCAC02_022491 [Chaenocephalus aceratus]
MQRCSGDARKTIQKPCPSPGRLPRQHGDSKSIYGEGLTDDGVRGVSCGETAGARETGETVYRLCRQKTELVQK